MPPPPHTHTLMAEKTICIVSCPSSACVLIFSTPIAFHVIYASAWTATESAQDWCVSGTSLAINCLLMCIFRFFFRDFCDCHTQVAFLLFHMMYFCSENTNRGPQAVVDRCGVCGGDGKSCPLTELEEIEQMKQAKIERKRKKHSRNRKAHGLDKNRRKHREL